MTRVLRILAIPGALALFVIGALLYLLPGIEAWMSGGDCPEWVRA